MRRIYLGILILMFVFLMTGNVQAVQKGLCAELSVTNINPSSVEIDEEFTVGIQIENCGDEIPEKATFEITRFSPQLLIKEPLKIEIGRIVFSNSERFLTYHIRTTTEASPGEYSVDMKLIYGRDDFFLTEEESFNITVTSEEAEINLASVKTNPVFPEKGKNLELSFRLENFGEGDADSVKAEIDIPEVVGNKKAFIGQLDSKEDGLVVFNLIPQKSGTFPYTIKISYSDDFGEHELTEDLELVVLKKKTSPFIFIILVFIAAITGLAFYFRKKRRRHFKALSELEKKMSGKRRR